MVCRLEATLNPPLRTVSLFAGIEAFGSGLEQTGAYKVVGHVELEEFRRRIIAKRFPESVCLGSDIRKVTAKAIRELKPQVICGGFPCKDLSLAGRGAGIVKGKHSSLWSEMFRLIKAAKPEIVLIENVRDLLTRGMEVPVRDLTSEGYSVEWDCLPAAAFGAPHLRDRIWIVAHRQASPCVFGRPTTLFAEPLRGAEPGRDFMRWPRAGFTDSPDECLDLIPLAPLKRFRNGKAKLLWPHLDRDFIPTPVADDVKGGVIAHIRNKHGWDDAERSAISSLAVLARNGMEEATPEQLAEARASVPERFPTPKESDAARSRGDLTSIVKGRPNAHSGGVGRIPTPTEADSRGSRNWAGRSEKSNPGTTLTDYAQQQEGVEPFPTPTAGDAERGTGSKHPRGNNALGAEAAERERFPTPTAQDAKNDGGPSQHERNSLPLNTHVKVYPTPEHSDGSGGRMSSEVGGTRPSGAKRAVTLATAARAAEREERWPTPKAEPSGPDFARDGRERSGGDDLATAAAREQPQVLGQLNPDWVEWLMGLPIGHTNPDVANEDLVVWPWDSEPPGIPRLVQNMPNRVARVSALGDSLVRAAAYWLGLAALRAVPSAVRPSIQPAAVAQSA